MRAVLVLVIIAWVAGCGSLTAPPEDAGSLIVPIPTGPPGGFPEHCESDAVCASGEVCARVGGCMAPDQVRSIHVTWTLTGRPANRTTCDATPDLRIQFATAGDEFIGYAPVPCSQGKFTIDKMPTAYITVTLGNNRASASYNGMLDAVTGEVAIDLPF